jgi:hypothetical protein
LVEKLLEKKKKKTTALKRPRSLSLSLSYVFQFCAAAVVGSRQAQGAATASGCRHGDSNHMQTTVHKSCEKNSLLIPPTSRRKDAPFFFAFFPLFQ